MKIRPTNDFYDIMMRMASFFLICFGATFIQIGVDNWDAKMPAATVAVTAGFISELAGFILNLRFFDYNNSITLPLLTRAGRLLRRLRKEAERKYRIEYSGDGFLVVLNEGGGKKSYVTGRYSGTLGRHTDDIEIRSYSGTVKLTIVEAAELLDIARRKYIIGRVNQMRDERHMSKMKNLAKKFSKRRKA